MSVERRKLINEYAKRCIRHLQEEYPELTWYLTLRDDNKDIMIGCDKTGCAVVVGTNYDDIVASLTLNKNIKY